MQTHDEDRLLRSSTQWQKKPKAFEVRLGNEAASFLKRHQRQFAKNAELVDVWDQVLPAGMKPYCRLETFHGGVLTVEATPGPYMHQLQMMQRELIAELQRRCPRVSITKLRINPIKSENSDQTPAASNQ
jgi:hypothetical protein